MKKTMLTTLLISSLIGAGMLTNDATVNAATHHHVIRVAKHTKKIHKKRHHISHKKVTKHPHKNTVHTSVGVKSGNNNDVRTSSSSSTQAPKQSIVNTAAYEQQYRAEALTEINALRTSVGVSPLVEDPTLDKIADMRVAQNIARGDGSISHYDNQGNALVDADAKQFGIDDGLGENLAGRSYDSDNDESDPVTVANELTHQYIDEGPENNDGKEHGHYENLVSPNYHTIGIGFGISSMPNDSLGLKSLYDAEDFSDDVTPSSNDNSATPNNGEVNAPQSTDSGTGSSSAMNNAD